MADLLSIIAQGGLQNNPVYQQPIKRTLADPLSQEVMNAAQTNYLKSNLMGDVASGRDTSSSMKMLGINDPGLAQQIIKGFQEADADRTRKAFFDLSASLAFAGGKNPQALNKMLESALSRLDPNQDKAIYEGIMDIVKMPDDQKTKGILEAIDMAQKLGVMPPAQLSIFDIANNLSLERMKAETDQKNVSLRAQELELNKKGETNLSKNLKQAGIMPGTPEFKQAVLDSIKRGKVEVNTGETQGAFEKEFGKKMAEDFFTRKTAAEDAVKSLNSIQEARRLLNSGVITGKGAEFITAFGSGLQTIGINIAPDAIANTQAFTASQAKQVAQIIKAFGSGTGLSDADREFAIKAAAGDITLTEGAIKRIVDINERASLNIIKSYNDIARKIEIKNPNIAPYPLTINPYSYQNNQQNITGGMTATNPKTGEKIIFRNGKWEKM